MNKMLKWFSLFLVLVLALPLASAFNYQIEPLKSSISPSEAAIFKVTVINDLLVEDYFTISSRDVNWVLTSTPPSATVSPESSITFTVELAPKTGLTQGNVYIVPVKIKSEKTGTFQEEGRQFAILLGDGAEQAYKCTITPLLYVDKVVDPRDPVSVRVNLRNRNAKEITDLTVSLKGGTEIDRSYNTTLGSLEEKGSEILFRIDPYTLPGKRTLSLLLYLEDELCAETSSEYEVLGYTDMQEKSSKASGFFKTDFVYEIYNNGNEQGIASKEFSMGFFERLFSRFEPDAVKEKDIAGQAVYVVKSEIGPRSILAIRVTTDYRLLVAFIILLIVATILYFLFRSPVIVYKSAEPIGKPTPEGLSDVKVRLFLKNRSSHQVTNVRVTDVIPTIAEMKKTTHVGSMDPISVNKGKKGMIARWEFASLEPYEERVIAYKIESKLKLVGGIRLPAAKARFESNKGRERVKLSNSVNLVHGYEEPVEEEAAPKKKR